MKCVKNLNTNEVKRVSNEHAERLADNKVWKFCPKSEWKALRVAPVKVEVIALGLPSVPGKPKKAKKGGK